jgi:hypothetical protein
VCHQTVGLVARAVEEAGIATLTMTVGRDITEHVRPPRAVFLDYPMGNEIGRPGNAAEQRRIVRAAFHAFEAMTEPGTIVDVGIKLELNAPDGRPWRDWVYTKEFRRHHMKTREGTRPE